MFPPELQPRSFRPHISASMSAPSFRTTFNAGYSPERNPNSSPNSGFYSNSTSRSSSSRSLKNSRFSPSSFAHNARVAIALVPCAAFLLDLGGTPVVAVLTLGLMIAYILDSLNFKSGSFFAVWLSLLSAQIAFFFSSSLFATFSSITLAILSALLCAQTNFLIGVWASLQFKYLCSYGGNHNSVSETGIFTQDGTFTGDANTLFHHGESSSTGLPVHQQEVPSSYSSIAGKEETANRTEKFYNSLPLPPPQHYAQPLLPSANRSIEQQPHYGLFC